MTTIRLHVWNNQGQTSLHPALGGGYDDMQLLQGRGRIWTRGMNSYPTPLHPHGTGGEVGGVDGGVDGSDKGASR
jgi:hypothetical protein